jgi:hypothetical protein
MKKALPLAVSLLMFLSFFYGAYLVLLTPTFFFSGHIMGSILVIPSLLWWLISLIKLFKEQRWGWLAGFLLLLPLAPLGLLAYDMSAVREIAN